MPFAGITQQRAPTPNRARRGQFDAEQVREIVAEVVEEDRALREVAESRDIARTTVGAIVRGDLYASVRAPLRARWPEVRRRRWRENGKKGGRPSAGE